MIISSIQVVVAYIIILVGVLIGAFLYFRPKIKAAKEIDKEIEWLNEQAQKTNKELLKRNEEIKQQRKELWNQKNQLDIEVQHQQEQVDNLRKTYAATSDEVQKMVDMQRTIADQAIEYREKCYETAKKEYVERINQLDEHYRETKEDYRREYNEMMFNAVLEYENTINEKIKLRDLLDEQLKDKTSKVSALVEESKRHYEEEHKKDFYRLCLTSDDISDVYELRQLIPHLNKAEPLNKVIWKTYYEKPYTDLIGRVVGSGIHTGIYKITNIDNQMCYVGQAVNIADRWKTHIKRGLGAEPPINNKLYPAMATYGVENFTFEIIEECDRNQLSEREDYWQEVFKAKEFGYSIK